MGDDEAYRPASARGRIAIGALALRSTAHVTQLLFIPFAPQLVAALGAETTVAVSRVVGVATFVALAVAGVAFLSWMHRATANARVFDDTLPYAPGDAVAAWLIPFVNLVRPYQIMAAIEIASLPSGARPRSLVASWWALYYGRIVIQVAVAALTQRLDHGERVLGACVSIAVELASVSLAISLVRYIDRIQDERARAAETLAEVFR